MGIPKPPFFPLGLVVWEAYSNWMISPSPWVPLCGTVCVFQSLLLSPHLLQNVYIHQYMYLCPPDCPCQLLPLCIVIWKHGFLCEALCVCCSHPTSGPTPWLECVYASVHAFMSTWLPLSPETNIHTYIHTYMESWVTLCLCPSHLISVLIPCLECVHASVYVLMSTWVPNSSPSPLHSYMDTWVSVCCTVCMFQSPCLWSHIFIKMCTCINTNIYVHPTPHVSSTPYG